MDKSTALQELAPMLVGKGLELCQTIVSRATCLAKQKGVHPCYISYFVEEVLHKKQSRIKEVLLRWAKAEGVVSSSASIALNIRVEHYVSFPPIRLAVAVLLVGNEE